ncbi:MAG: malto-oligosyltrehalose trehalohydrolase [Myxococcota bacterium]
MQRRLPIGAELIGDGVHFRVWAPDHERVAVVIDGERTEPLKREANGYYAAFVRGMGEGTRYAYRLGDDTTLYPDPASRFQPEGPHGASCVIDWKGFIWGDNDWPGLKLEGQVLYELHIGTFTPEGTFAAARSKLADLADLGVTCLEVMPLADFAGDFGWGYDGVNWFAPTRLYGKPDDFRRFVDAAHAAGIGVILDVVYNHLGPDGNYMPRFSSAYLSKEHGTDWGQGINFDGENSAPVRDCVRANVRHWVEEYHLDGLRLDATQDIHDDSSEHILSVISQEARAAAGRRGIILVGENEPQDTRLVRPIARGGYGLDALWNDDMHHSAMVAATGRREAYFTDYHGTATELIAAAKWGYLYQGQRYVWQKKRRGTFSLDIAPASFITFLENHDQVANLAFGRRLGELTHPSTIRALTAYVLLCPGTPLLFQGQEFGASARFAFFAGHSGELADAVRKGRAEYHSQFASAATDEIQGNLPDPSARATFDAAVLDWSEREKNVMALALHRDLLRLRRETPAFAAQKPRMVDGAPFSRDCLLLRFFADESADDRLLIINLGADLDVAPAPEPLLGLEQHLHWDTIWSSERVCYGGLGTAAVDDDDRGLRIPSRSAVVLAAKPRKGT